LSLDLNVDSVVDDVTSGGREFHVRDAYGKWHSVAVRRNLAFGQLAGCYVQCRVLVRIPR